MEHATQAKPLSMMQNDLDPEGRQ